MAMADMAVTVMVGVTVVVMAEVMGAVEAVAADVGVAGIERKS